MSPWRDNVFEMVIKTGDREYVKKVVRGENNRIFCVDNQLSDTYLVYHDKFKTAPVVIAKETHESYVKYSIPNPLHFTLDNIKHVIYRKEHYKTKKEVVDFICEYNTANNRVFFYSNGEYIEIENLLSEKITSPDEELSTENTMSPDEDLPKPNKLKLFFGRRK